VTFDGLTSADWFTVARVLATAALLLALGLLVVRSARRAVQHIADHRRAEREHRARLDGRRWLSETPAGYLRGRCGAVSNDND
jgi:hypothetical protein